MKELADRKYIHDTIELRQIIEQSFLDLGERLAHIREKKLWKVDYESFDEFLVDLNVGKSLASKLMRIYEVFVKKCEIPSAVLSVLPWTSLYQLSRIIDTKEQAEAALQEMPYLKGNDLRMKIHELLTGKPCEHEWHEIHLRVCSHCPAKERITL